MNTQENNKLIAEFMGFTLDTPTNIEGEVWYDNEEVYLHISSEFKHSNCFKELQFFKSWDWLMTVVKKIYEIAVDDENIEVFYEVSDNLPDRHETYNAVVEFIIEYNKNK